MYIVCLSLLLAVSVTGTAWCGWLILSGDNAGLVNLGKFLLLFLYSAYRLRAILVRSYQIYRPWESGAARAVKRAAHGFLAFGVLLFILAGILLTGAFDLNFRPWLVAAIAVIVLGFLALEATNVLNPDRSQGR